MPGAALLTVVILITLSGIPTVNIQIPVTVGANIVELPVTPIEASIVVTVNGTPASHLLNDSMLYIVSDVDGVADISYVANINVANSGVISFNISEAYVKLYIPDNVVLLMPPSNVSALGSEVINGTRYTVVEFYGPQTVEYMVLNVFTQTVATSTTTAAPFTQSITTYTIITGTTTPYITTAPTTQQTTQTAAPPQTAMTTGAAGHGLTMYIIAAAIVIVLAIAVILLIRRRFCDLS